MNNLRQERKAKGLTQDQMEELTGIGQPYYSEIERGVNIPGEKTRRKIESVIGKVDWIETASIKLHNPNWYRAERLLKSLVEATFNMEKNQKQEFTKMVHKYFK